MTPDRELYIIDAVKYQGIYGGLAIEPHLQKRYVAIMSLTDHSTKEKLLVDLECFDSREEAKEWFDNWKEQQ